MTLIHPTVKAFSFDAGGTLIRPTPSVGDIYAEILAEFGISAEPAVLNARFKTAFREIRSIPIEPCNATTERLLWEETVRRTFGPVCPPPAQFTPIFEALYATFQEGRRWRIYPDVMPALENLKARGYRMVILSNNDSRLRPLLDDLGLLRFMEDVFISCEIGVPKPNRRAFDHVAKAMDLPPETLLHIGDDLQKDGIGARDAGWQSALVRQRLPPPADITTFATLKDLTNALTVNE